MATTPQQAVKDAALRAVGRYEYHTKGVSKRERTERQQAQRSDSPAADSSLGSLPPLSPATFSSSTLRRLTCPKPPAPSSVRHAPLWVCTYRPPPHHEGGPPASEHGRGVGKSNSPSRAVTAASGLPGGGMPLEWERESILVTSGSPTGTKGMHWPEGGREPGGGATESLLGLVPLGPCLEGHEAAGPEEADHGIEGEELHAGPGEGRRAEEAASPSSPTSPKRERPRTALYEAYGVVGAPKGMGHLSMASASGFDLWRSYGTQLPWTPVRFDRASALSNPQWVHNERPVHNAVLRVGEDSLISSTAAHKRAMRLSRSLPALVRSSYYAKVAEGEPAPRLVYPAPRPLRINRCLYVD